VLLDASGARVDRIVNLGDVVGYGPWPEECYRLLKTEGIPSVLGNHEWLYQRETHRRWFNRTTRVLLEVTDRLLSERSKSELAALPVTLRERGALFVHGAPPDSVVRYLHMYSDEAMARAMRRMEAGVCFAGHTHDLGLIVLSAKGLERRGLGKGITRPPENALVVVNVGAVGQPRDDYDRSAKYVIWDNVSGEIETRFVAYDAGPVVREMIRVDFPESLAARLL